MSNGDTVQQSPTTAAGWAKMLLQFGFAATLLVGVLYWVGENMLIPMRDLHVKFVDGVARNNEVNAVTQSKNAETLTRQTTLLEELRADKRTNSR